MLDTFRGGSTGTLQAKRYPTLQTLQPWSAAVNCQYSAGVTKFSNWRGYTCSSLQPCSPCTPPVLLPPIWQTLEPFKARWDPSRKHFYETLSPMGGAGSGLTFKDKLCSHLPTHPRNVFSPDITPKPKTFWESKHQKLHRGKEKQQPELARWVSHQAFSAVYNETIRMWMWSK